MSTAYIYKQDPSTTEIDQIRLTYTPFPVEDGPKDDRVRIVGMGSPMLKDSQGDFLVDPQKDPKAFDAVHVFMVTRQVLTLFDRALHRLGLTSRRAQWNWGTQPPISVHPYAGVDENAYYSRAEKAIKYFYFQNPKNPEERIYACRSFDVVAHEVGHAVLDGLMPGFFTSWHPQTGGFHESFGDITAIVTMLAQSDMCEAIIAHSKADLHNKSFFPTIAEQFGEALGLGMQGLRNADNDLRLDQVSDEVHDLSQVFTGAFYDILADIFVDMRNVDNIDDAQILFQAGQAMTDILLGAILQGPKENVSYADLAQNMQFVVSKKYASNAARVTRYQQIIQTQFERRGVTGSNGTAVAKVTRPVDLQWRKCRCCMSHHEHVQAVEQAIRRKQSCCGGGSSDNSNQKNGEVAKQITPDAVTEFEFSPTFKNDGSHGPQANTAKLY